MFRPIIVGALIAAACLSAFLIGTLAIGSASAWTTDDPSAQLHGRCFPAAKWGEPTGGTTTADDNTRPCVRITRVYEDGSFKAAVQDADGPVRYSIGVGVPDSYECASGAASAACR